MINITYKILESMAIDIEKSKIEFRINNIEIYGDYINIIVEVYFRKRIINI